MSIDPAIVVRNARSATARRGPSGSARIRAPRNEWVSHALPIIPQEVTMTEKKGHGSAAAKKANAKASREGKSNPRTSSSAQAELGKKGGKSKS